MFDSGSFAGVSGVKYLTPDHSGVAVESSFLAPDPSEGGPGVKYLTPDPWRVYPESNI